MGIRTSNSVVQCKVHLSLSEPISLIILVPYQA